MHFLPCCLVPYFYPRSPCGERRSTVSVGDVGTDFYPRSPCGERLLAVPGEVVCEVISIHALLAESDPRQCVVGLGYFISIHALLAESDCGLWALYWRHTRFLSTLSLRRATAAAIYQPGKQIDFYPRSPCGERLGYKIMEVV